MNTKTEETEGFCDEMSKIILPILSDKDWDATNDYVSKSRIQLFEMCNIKYKKQYIDRCIPREGSHASTVGTRFHEFAELFTNIAEKYPEDKWKSFIHPEFTQEETDMLEWYIDYEIERKQTAGEFWKPVAMEFRAINHQRKIRGIIDRVVQTSHDTIDIGEYKTTQSINKQKLMFEFGFYEVLLENIPELKGFKRTYTVINPRLKQVVSFNPSRLATIIKKINKLNDAIKNNEFKPACKYDYVFPWCNICTMEEITVYNGLTNIRSD
jgi:hypothetical protein